MSKYNCSIYKAASLNNIVISLNLKTLILLVLISSVFWSVTVTANTEAFDNVKHVNINPNKYLELVIGREVANRIHVVNREIQEIIGDENKYSINWSMDYQNMFITPKAEVGEIIDISLLLFGGEVQDIRFTVGDCSAQAIVLIPNKVKDACSLNNEFNHEVAEMVRAMIKGEKRKYYVVTGKRFINCDEEKKLTQIKSYSYKDLTGAYIEITNKTNKELLISQDIFKDIFKSVIATEVCQERLPARGKTYAVVISRASGSVK
jgi:hypothetical protein